MANYNSIYTGQQIDSAVAIALALKEWAKGNSKPTYSWSEITNKPSWIGSSKPTYSWSEIGSKPSWIGSSKPSYNFSEIGSKPTTLSGYGITDGIKRSDTLQTTNPFGGYGPYISKIDNAFYCAEKRWTVTGSYTGASSGTFSQSDLSQLFNGDYESILRIPAGCTATIRITFDTVSSGESQASTGTNGVFPGYPYGYAYISYYYINHPEVHSTMNMYCNYEPHGIGIHSGDCSPYVGSYTNGTSGLVEVVRQSFYAMTYIEFIISAPSTVSHVGVTQIEMKLDRPDSSRTPFINKYKNENLYNTLNTSDLLPRNTNTSIIGNSNKQYVSIYSRDIYEDGTSLADKYQAKGTYLTSHQDISGKADKASITAGWYRRVQVNAQGIVIGGDQTDANDDTNTWRKVQLNGVDKLGNGISTNPLNIKAGSNVTITESSGTFTFAATDTTYESKSAASGGTAVSLVTTGEKYTWNNKATINDVNNAIQAAIGDAIAASY